MWPTLWLKLDFHHHRLLPIWFSRQIMKTATTTTFKKNYVSRVSRSSRRDWFEGGCCTHRAHQPDTRHSCGFLTHHQRVRDKRKIILYHFVRWFFFLSLHSFIENASPKHIYVSIDLHFSFTRTHSHVTSYVFISHRCRRCIVVNVWPQWTYRERVHKRLRKNKNPTA